MLIKLILFIVDHWGNAEKEICSHTDWTWSHIWEHHDRYSLASWFRGLSTDWLILLSLHGRASLFLSTTTANQGNGALVTSGSATCLVGIGFAVVDCIPVLLGMNIGIYIPVELQLPTHIIGPDTTTTSVSLSSSAFQFPLEPAPLAVTLAKVHLWMNLPFPSPRLLHLFLNPTDSCSESAGISMWVASVISSPRLLCSLPSSWNP